MLLVMFLGLFFWWNLFKVFCLCFECLKFFHKIKIIRKTVLIASITVLLSAPGFSNRAMWKMPKVKINLITDANMHLIIEKWIRGGRCEPIYCHAKANNKYINPNFDKKEIKNHTLLV